MIKTSSKSTKSKSAAPLPVAGQVTETLDEAMQRGTKFAQAKDFDSANALFQRLLKSHPDQPRLWLQYGLVKIQSGENSLAQEMLQKCIKLQPDMAPAHKLLGLALMRQAQPEAALEEFAKAEPALDKDPDLHYYKGQALGTIKQLEPAVKSVGKALSLRPDYAPYLHTLGTLFAQLKMEKRALPILYRALDGDPTMWAARMALGHVLMKMGRHKEAISHYAEVLRDAPDRLDVMTNLGNAYLATDQYDTAEAQFTKLREMFPDQAAVYNNLGNFYSKANRYDEALTNYRLAVERQEVYPEAWNNYAITLRRLNRVEESLAGLEKAISQKDSFPDAQWNRSLSLLLLGRIEEGFEAYEWRWRGGVKELRPRKLGKPQWQRGESIQGKRLFVHSEQGMGDHIQFMRYLPMLQAQGAQVLAEFPEPLLEIAKDYAPEVIWIERGTRKFPEFDLYCPLLSLPTLLGTNKDNIPGPKSYLSAKPERKAHFRERLKDATGLRVGLVWSGNPKHANDRNRSLALKDLMQALGSVPFTAVSLMKEVRPEDQVYLREHTELLDLSQELDNFADTAALISNLDLVVSVDTSVAHLAGALGCPVWMLTPFAPDWRWMLERKDTPWYPTMRLYRQHTPHDWDAVLAELAADLKQQGQHSAARA